MTLTLAHVSDVHLAPMPRFKMQHWRLKRALGYLNWQRRRRPIHRADVVEALAGDLAAQRPDHIAVTGDLVNIGLPEEYANALTWLRTIGSPQTVSVVPGNHDAYVRLHSDPGMERWRAYMTSDSWGLELTGGRTGFPYVRRLGPIALIGLSSAVPTPLFVAAGRLGEDQIERLGPLLDKAAAAGLARVILIHHPPLPGQASSIRGLQDAVGLQKVISAHGAELILHGHNHIPMRVLNRWHAGVATVIGVPSFSAGRNHHREPLARYNLIRIRRETHGLHIELISRGLAEPGGPIVEIERHRLDQALTLRQPTN